MSLPTVYETTYVRVFHNHSGEIFVEHKKSGAMVRVGDRRDSLIVTASGCEMRPTAVNGLSAFQVYKPSK